MNVKTILVTGLIGSEAVEHFNHPGYQVVGIDYNMRREFFGAGGDALWNLNRIIRPRKFKLSWWTIDPLATHRNE